MSLTPGAIGALIADNTGDTPPAALGGTLPGLTITAVRIVRDQGNAIKAQLASLKAVSATIGLDMTRCAGANQDGYAQVNATNPIVPGSSIAHCDSIASPNLLMEPNINSDLDHSLDLTLPLLHDIGWLDEDDRHEHTVPTPDRECPAATRRGALFRLLPQRCRRVRTRGVRASTDCR
jgi:hypothetical protein